MRRARESDPALVAHGDAESRTELQVPCDFVPFYIQRSFAGVLFDLILAASEIEARVSSPAQFQVFRRESLNECVWPGILRKACCPHLHGHSSRIGRATLASGIGEQVAEPPS